MISLSVTEASRGFSDLINRIRYRGESVTLLKSGTPVAQVIPVKSVVTGADLAREWAKLSRLGPEEAAAFESDLIDSRSTLGTVESKWD